MIIALLAVIGVLVLVERVFARRVLKRSERKSVVPFAVARGLRLLAIALMFGLIALSDVPWWVRVLTGLVACAGIFGGVAFLWAARRARTHPTTPEKDATSATK